MTLPKHIITRERDRFVEDADGNVAVRTLPTGGATSANQDSLLTELEGKADADETQPVELQTGSNKVGGVDSYGYNGTNWHPTGIDTATRTLQTIEYEHHEIHSGSSFHCHFENLTTNIGEQSVIAFNTPDTTKWIHIIVVCVVGSITRCSIVEAPSIDVDEGTQLNIYNRDRNSDNTSIVTSIATTPVVNKVTSFNEAQATNANITETIQLDAIVLGAAGANPAKSGVGGQARGQLEWILKQGTQYAFMAESLSADDNIHVVELNWYEHTNKAV